MTMSYPGEPFAEAVGEAVQTSTVAVRLLLAVADAVRRAAQRKSGPEHPLPPTDQALTEAAGDLKARLAPDVAWMLMSSPDWPIMARQLVALRRAGVDLERFLPRVGDIAVSVRDAVLSDSARITTERTQEWARLLRATMPAGPVREAILASPTWPEIAAAMQALQERGVDIRGVLAAAYAEGTGVGQAIDRGLDAARRRADGPSRDSVRSYGPLTVGLDLPKDLDLGDRRTALAQLGVSQTENACFVRWVYEALPGREREAALLVNSRPWPLLAARMARMQDDGTPVRDRLARLMRDRGWESGPVPYLVPRLVQATVEALHRPTNDAVPSAAVVIDAARASSATAGRPPSSARDAERAGPEHTAHRARIPKPKPGRSR
ncbi:hypothetical protein ABZW03_06330 [Kitasatospora sp. NPDC004799]|uniref:hypothetical protein n=1 Tax=Kitasatospora sp. NPDC004799 TaxID=3154460 RepID=UPI0033A99917